MRGRVLLALLAILLAAGVGAGPIFAAGQEQGDVIHVVAWGETLFSIARHYETSVQALSAANGISDPSHIYPGQRLVIPGTLVPQAPEQASAVHVVQPGENLFRIALSYGTTARALAELNGITNPDHLLAGRSLTIPGSPTLPSVSYQPSHASGAHTVQRGETLTAIAQRYGVSLWQLIQANNLANPSLILPGQTLVVPTSRSEAVSSPPAPSGAAGAKQVVIDLSEQHLYAYEGETQVYSFVASTGMPGAGTRTGSFRVLDKIPNAYASTWDLQMPHWLGIYWAGSLENGIHALPILSNGQRLWQGYLGAPVSYGCVILGVEEARMLYEWAEVGTSVTIRH